MATISCPTCGAAASANGQTCPTCGAALSPQPAEQSERQSEQDAASYYLLIGGQEQGPWTLGEVRTFWQVGAVTLETLYARPGMNEWKALSAILGLRPPIESTSALVITPADESDVPTDAPRAE